MNVNESKSFLPNWQLQQFHLHNVQSGTTPSLFYQSSFLHKKEKKMTTFTLFFSTLSLPNVGILTLDFRIIRRGFYHPANGDNHWQIAGARESLLKGRDQCSWPPCTNWNRSVTFHTLTVFCFSCYKTTYLNEEVNCSEPSPSTRVPWLRFGARSFCQLSFSSNITKMLSIRGGENFVDWR